MLARINPMVDSVLPSPMSSARIPPRGFCFSRHVMNLKACNWCFISSTFKYFGGVASSVSSGRVSIDCWMSSNLSIVSACWFMKFFSPTLPVWIGWMFWTSAITTSLSSWTLTVEWSS